MRILVIGINYAPERTSVAPFTTGLCEHLAAREHQVTVITAFPYYPEWRVWASYRGSLYRRELIHGVEVRRVAHFIPARPSSLLQRLAYDLSFTMAAFIAALFTGKCNLIYCSCPPPTVAFAAYLLGLVKSAPFVMKLTDIASDAASSTGIMKSSVCLRLARTFERFTYRRARAVICLCQGFIDRLSPVGSADANFLLIPDWGQTEQIHPLERDFSFRRAHGIPRNAFLVMHTGNMGKKQDLMNVVLAAQLCGEDSEIIWLLVGEGEERGRLEQQAARLNLRNLRFLPLQPAAALPQMYAAADALLLNQKGAIEDAVIPSKLLTYMASGKAVVAAVNKRSEAARQILRANCGVLATPEDPRALVETVRALRAAPAFCQELGRNGRAHAEQHFTKASVLRRYDEFLSILCHKAPELAIVPSHSGTD